MYFVYPLPIDVCSCHSAKPSPSQSVLSHHETTVPLPSRCPRVNRRRNCPPPRSLFAPLLAETPRCGEYPECTTCAEDEDCAWCASEGACMTVSEIFSMDCRGTVFDLPCPTSFIAGEGPRRAMIMSLSGLNIQACSTA